MSQPLDYLGVPLILRSQMVDFANLSEGNCINSWNQHITIQYMNNQGQRTIRVPSRMPAGSNAEPRPARVWLQGAPWTLRKSDEAAAAEGVTKFIHSARRSKFPALRQQWVLLKPQTSHDWHVIPRSWLSTGEEATISDWYFNLTPYLHTISTILSPPLLIQQSFLAIKLVIFVVLIPCDQPQYAQ